MQQWIVWGLLILDAGHLSFFFWLASCNVVGEEDTGLDSTTPQPRRMGWGCAGVWSGVRQRAISSSESVARVHPPSYPLLCSLPGKNAQFPQNVQRRRSVDRRAASSQHL